MMTDPVSGVDLPAAAAATTIAVQPNPVVRGGACTVYCAAPSPGSFHAVPRIILVDILGREHAPGFRVERRGDEFTLSFSTEELSAGIYLVRVAGRASVPLVVR